MRRISEQITRIQLIKKGVKSFKKNLTPYTINGYPGVQRTISAQTKPLRQQQVSLSPLLYLHHP